MIILNIMTENGLINCWPIPPMSGWEAAKAHYLETKKLEEAFESSWIGNNQIKGERENEIMKLCFGNHCEASFFTKSPIFKTCIEELYKPICENIDYINFI